VSIDFLVTSLIVVVSPGTGVLYTLAAGLSRGSRASVVAAFGCTLGIVPHMAAAIMGLAALLHTSALAFQALKYLGSSPSRVGKRDGKSGSDGGVGQGFGHVRGSRNLA
jgi:threonine/homoserine/homoserine lactone efflux protein